MMCDWANADVLPTCVGMVRTLPGRTRQAGSSPHVRGDGPDIQSLGELFGGFSPRAWGWSTAVRKKIVEKMVLPTCVGMVRQSLTPLA